jgi:protein O-mannosyl-transferase
MKNPANHKTAQSRERATARSTKAADYRRLITQGMIPALVAGLSALAFLPVLQNDFVNWDDFDTLLVNPHYQGFGLEQLRWMFTTFFMGHYQPLSWMTWDLDYLIWGKNPFGYHLTNLGLHGANAVLFYFVSRRLLELTSPGSDQQRDLHVSIAAAWAALLFALHPLRVESVGWITERRDVLSAHFLFWTLWYYLRAVTSQEAASNRRRWLAIGWVFFLLSLLSKAWGMTLPVLLCVLDVYPLKRLSWNPAKWLTAEFRPVLLEKMPFMIPAVIFAVVAIIAQKTAGAMGSLEGYPLSRRIAQAFYGLAFYLWKTLWPTSLSPLYPIYLRFDPLSRPYLISAFAVLALTAILFLMRKRWPAGLAAWACYVVLLSPVLGLVQSGLQFVADRYSYLSCLSWAVLAGAGLLVTLRTRSALLNARQRFLLITGSATAVLLVLGVLTWRYTLIWRNSESLWRHAAAMEPQSNLVHFHLANVLRVRKKLPEAVEHFQTALAIDPDYTQVYHDYSLALAGLGEFDQAIEYMRKYIEKTPPSAPPHVEIGIYLSRQGKTDEEIRAYRRALEIDPQLPEAYYGLGNAFAVRGELEEAKRNFMRAIELNPEKSEFFFSLGNLLVKQNSLEQAEENFRRAIKVKPDFPMARNNLGRLLAAKGDLAGAMEHFREALRVDPWFAPGHESMAQLLAQLGRREEAMEHYREAVRLAQPEANSGVQR